MAKKDSTAQPEDNVPVPGPSVKDRDIASLIDDGSYAFDELDGVQLALEVRKPDREWHIRTHPDVENYWRLVRLIEMKNEPHRGFWLPDRPLYGRLEREPCCKRFMLILSVNSDGIMFFWPIPAPTSDFTRATSMAQRAAAEVARDNWVRVTWSGQMHLAKVIEANHRDPQWPEEDFATLLQKAFREQFIDDVVHPVIKHLGV